jgi:hypothetical protein
MDNPLHDKVFATILASNRFELIDSRPIIDKLLDFAYPSEEHAVALFKSKTFKEKDTKRPPQTIPTVVVDKNQNIERVKRRVLKTANEEVEVILLANGNYHLTKDCILSILEHVKYPKYRITLYDTGSTHKVLQQYRDLEHSVSNLICREVSPFNFSKNYNQAIANSECSYVLILNNDTVALNDFVSKMMKYATNNKVGAVGCQLFYPNNTIQHGGQSLFDVTGKLLPEATHLLQKFPVTYQPNRFVDGVTCACALINKGVYEEVGGLGVEYQDIFQDTDLMLKLRDAGYEIYLSNDAKMIHYDGATRDPFNLPATKTMMKDMDTFQDAWANKTMVKGSKRGIINNNPDPVFSFVTLVTGDGTDYNEFLDSIQTDVEYEVIGIKNYDNFFDCPTGLNVGAELSVGKYIVFCHQDILLCPQWCEKALNHISSIEEEVGENWGVLGIAGVASVDPVRDNSGRSYLADSPTGSIDNTKEAVWSRSDATSESDILFDRVLTVDELLMVCKNRYTTDTSERYFDPKLPGFHFYGGDICLNQRYKFGAESYVINCPVFHKSIDGTKNLQSAEQWRDYVNSRQRFGDKWKSRGISRVETTTCCMNMDGVVNVPPSMRDR